jgi:Abnormal spindle-like microcephaly-assoc'd, ASPM-SPD-2-Hydin
MRRLPLLLVALVCGLAVATLSAPRSSVAADQPAPIFAATVNPLTFDFVNVGDSSGSKTVTIGNTGTAPLVFTKVELLGRDKQDFAFSSETCAGQTLAPGQTCSIGVRFAPTKSGTRAAVVRFTDNTACHDFITLAGSGQETISSLKARAATCETSVLTTTTTSTTTTTTTTGSGGSSTPVSANSVVNLSKTCSSRRTVTVRLTAPAGKTFTAVKIMLRGKTIKTLKGKKIKTKISLAGLPRGRFTVRVRATTNDGKSFVRTHYYVTCVSKK